MIAHTERNYLPLPPIISPPSDLSPIIPLLILQSLSNKSGDSVVMHLAV